MKIIFFMDNNQMLGGAAQTLLRQASLMKNAGYDVVVALDCVSGMKCAFYNIFCSQNHIKTLPFPLSTSNQPEDINISFILEHYENAKKKIEKEAPDILHSVQLNPLIELAARELNIPHIMNIYPAIPDFFKIDYIDVFPKYHICDSEYYAGVWGKYLHTESVCIRTAADRGNGHRKSPQKDQVIRCICVGGVYKRKNQLSVIKACHRAIRSGIRLKLSVYGSYAGNSYGEECASYIQEHDLRLDIELKGYCDNMSEVYQESDVLICGSTRESYPNVISEALANGVVVISTPVAGVPEVIRDKQNGYLCKGYSADDICEKIVELNTDIASGAIREIVRNANITYERVHSPESVTAKLEQYYQWLLKNFKGKKPVSMDFLKTAFMDIISIYCKHKKVFSDPEKVQRKLWYLYHIQNRIREQIAGRRDFYIWGTGKYGKVVYEMAAVYFEDMEISGFIDSFKTGQYMEKPIYKPEKVLGNKKSIVLVATVNGQSEIIEQLEENNKKYIEDYYILSQRWW